MCVCVYLHLTFFFVTKVCAHRYIRKGADYQVCKLLEFNYIYVLVANFMCFYLLIHCDSGAKACATR